MKESTRSPRVVRFGVFEVDLRTGELRRSGLKIRLQDQPFQILAMLLERPGEVVTREELGQRLWPADTFVDFDRGLNTSIKRLREALGDSADNPRFIETLPRRGYRFIAAVEGASRPKLLSGKILLIVLPFENLSGDPTQEYFSDGMTEEMITELARLNPEALGVIARTSAMQYKSTNKGIDQIGHELGVDYILEGSVRRAGNRVRISAQLIQASDQTHLWADSYDRDLEDILTLQGEVARAIAGEIRIKVTPREQTRLASPRPVNRESHEAYLKGRYYWNKFTEEGLRKGLEYFQQAIAIDPGYALAYAGLADSYTILGSGYGYLPPNEAYPRAKVAAKKALEIDDTLPEAYTSLGAAKLFYDWDWRGAEQVLKRAIELNPSYCTAYELYGFFLQAMGRLNEALREVRRALELDPLSLISNTDVGLGFLLARQYDQAIEQCQKSLEMDPNFIVAHEYLGRAYLEKSMFEESIAEFQKAITLSGGKTRFKAFLGNAYAASQRRGEALKLLHELQEFPTQRYVSSYDIATIYIGLGEKERAFEWLGKAYEERSCFLLWLKVDPIFDTLRSDPRFQDLLRRMNIPP